MFNFFKQTVFARMQSWYRSYKNIPYCIPLFLFLSSEDKIYVDLIDRGKDRVSFTPLTFHWSLKRHFFCRNASTFNGGTF